MPNRDQFVADLLDWLNRRLAPPGVTLTADSALFQDRLIDSIRILELIAWVERAVGGPIPDEMIRMDFFHSPRRIAEVFVPEARHVER